MKRSFFRTVASFFAFLCVVFIPFPFNITKAQLAVTDFIFGNSIGFISKNIFDKTLADTHVYSDTVSMYILVLLLFILAVLISLVLLRVKKWPAYRPKFLAFFYQLFCYYLALQLLKYGADKIFKNQFYLPEPNTLYTPMGKVSKGLLYWSSMGTSYFYNIFLGVLEGLAGVLILVKRTRLLGLLLGFGIMLNVAAINFGFDISVKLYSLFLLYLTVYLLLPYCSRMYQLLLIGKKNFDLPAAAPAIVGKRSFFPVFLKCLAAGIICLEVFYPFIKANTFNGDFAKRPYMHGAYEVKQMIAGTDTLAAKDAPLKRFFIHKDSYIIFQSQADDMQDYKLTYDLEKYVYVLTDYQKNRTTISLDYRDADSTLTLKYFKGDKEYKLTGKAIDWKKLPALEKSFHWTVD